MTVAASDLMYPNGEVQAGWFPDGDAETNLTLWIAEADVSTIADANDADDATKAYAYARAYNTVAGRLAGMPTMERTLDMTTSIGSERVAYFARKAEEWQAVYDFAVALRPIPQPTREQTSYAVKARAVW